MAGIAGRLIGLQIGGVYISCELSCDITFSVDMLPASAVDSAGWKEFIAGIRSWAVNVNGQLLTEAVGADFKTIVNAIYSRLPVFLIWGTKPSAMTQMTISGIALPTSANATAPNKGAATWNVSFQGTGAPTTSFEDFSLLIDAMPASADYPIIVDEDVT